MKAAKKPPATTPRLHFAFQSTSDAQELLVGESLVARLRPAGRRVITIRRASREDFLQNNAFSAFATFHGFYESLKLKHRARHNLIELVVEPLFVFAR